MTGAADVEGRRSLAKQLVKAGKLDEALVAADARAFDPSPEMAAAIEAASAATP